MKCENITEASLGEEANFSCNFLLPMDVLQVTWQKINGSSFQNIATYSQAYGLRLIGSFQRKARFIRAALNTSAITLQNLTFEDVSCYRCIFNAFPRGSFSSEDICLNIQSKFSTSSFSLSGMQHRCGGVRGQVNCYPLHPKQSATQQHLLSGYSPESPHLSIELVKVKKPGDAFG